MHCQKCKTTEDLLTKPIAGNSYMCRRCHRERMRKYRTTPHGKKATIEAIKRSESRYPGKQEARKKVATAVKSGKLFKPEICSLCANSKKLDAHHPDYSEALLVMWLCRQCHTNLHKHEKVIM